MKTTKKGSGYARLCVSVMAIVFLLQGSASAEPEQVVASALEKTLVSSTNVFFIMIGAVMILAMHGGFAFLEVGSVRKKNQVNALNKIICEWSFSTLIYFLIGYPIARGISLLVPISEVSDQNGFEYVKFFFLLGFAACIPAIISGGVAERAKFWTNAIAGGVFVGVVYPLIEAFTWGRYSGFLGDTQGALASWFGFPFHDFAGSVVVHATGGWLALPAIMLLGNRLKRCDENAIKVSSIPFLALGSWALIVGWFGFNVMSSGNLEGMSGLVAINSLMAMAGGTIAAMFVSKNDAGFVHNGALAGLVAVCAGSDLYHPVAALVVGSVAGALFVFLFQIETGSWKIDDVLGVWPLHGMCGVWGGIAAGVFGLESLGGKGGVSFFSQLVVTGAVVLFTLLASTLVYGLLKMTVGIRVDCHEELVGCDLTLHQIQANPEEAM